MKAIMMSIRPQHVVNIMNLIKLLEIRKMFPSDYVGWVYIYVTKDRNKTLSYQVIPHDRKTSKGYNGFNDKDFDFQFMTLTKTDINNGWGWFARNNNLNGKVVARFWCDKVEALHIKHGIGWETETIKGTQEIEKVTCITRYNLYEYCKGKAYAIHITNLDIFDKPKEISEFVIDRKKYKQQLYRAPQSWCYVEI